ncbi:MAG: response regulator [Anaerovoracaceae bacterium]
MGGTIKVESQLGIGSTFTVDWEFKQANEEEVEGGKTKKGCFFPEQGLAGKRILLAEDHPLNTEIAKKILEKKGIQVDCVVNGKLAVEQFSASAPGDYHGIILDIRMPIMDGLEAARGIRRLGRKDAKQIPIIAMSANAFEDDVQKSLNAGMDAHLSKPVEPEKLFKTLRTLL